MAGRDVLNRTGLYGHASQCLLRQVWWAALASGKIRSASPWLFLDEGLNYSCAFVEDPVRETIEHAQLNKLQRVTVELDLRSPACV